MLKKIALFLICALPISLMAQQETKLGHVNFQEIFSSMPEQAGIQKALDDQSKEFETYLTKMNEELTTKLKEFQEKQATMPESIKQTRQNELQDIQQRIQTFRQTASTDLEKKQQELSAPIMAKINKAISDIAAEGKYLYVFNYLPQVFIYQAPGANDITPLVKKRLGLDKPVETKKPAEVKPTEPAESKTKTKK
jgi:outer membrane protein